MSESARDLLVRGLAAAKDKSKEEARFYLEWVLRIDATLDQRIEAWWWLSEVSDDVAEKRGYLENILAHNPAHPLARRRLAVLDGRLDPAEIVDPDRLSSPVPETPRPVQARRFVCRQCGGRMSFTPDGKTLTCAYCDRQQPLLKALEEGAMVEEQDFLIALPTAKGHTRPVVTRSLRCQGCRASFMLAPQMLSFNCPYCASAYVVEQVEEQELIPPEGIIPFALTRDQAYAVVLEWLEAEVVSPTGVYLDIVRFQLLSLRGAKRRSNLQSGWQVERRRLLRFARNDTSVGSTMANLTMSSYYRDQGKQYSMVING